MNASRIRRDLHSSCCFTLSATIPRRPIAALKGGIAVLVPLTRIDHVGIACVSLEEKVSFYESGFGFTVVSREVNEGQGVREAILALPDPPPGSPYLQLVEPLWPDSPVGRFIARRGEGMHHIGYAVTDIEKALASLRSDGLTVVNERPQHGSGGASVAFIHPSSMGGVLTELVQPVNER
jgi:methylmalonyl-CoA/ethylmalonyl-CoA epimerase